MSSAIYASEAGSARIILGGDVMLGRALTGFDEPAYRALVDLMRSADLAIANLETSVRHPDEGAPNISPGTYMSTPPALLDDLKRFGVGMVTCANNHAFDFGEGGIRATSRHLADYGIPYAGIGANLTLARKPCFADTRAGRIGMVGVTATFNPWNRAGEARPDVPGRPGVSALRSDAEFRIPTPDLEALDRLAQNLGFRREIERNRQHFFSEREAPPEDAGQTVFFLDRRFVRGDAPGVATRADPRDVESILRWIREARRQCDWLVVSVHSHEYGFESLRSAQKRSDMVDPADFVVQFCRRAIEAGADVVAGHGSHTPLAIECHEGRPIFFGLGNLIFHNDTAEQLPADAYERFDLPPESTPADFQDTRTAGDTKGHPADRAFWESLIAECRLSKSGALQVLLHPIDLGFGRPRSQRGRPVLAGLEVARRVLDRLSTLSTPRGLTIRLENGIGLFELPNKKH